MSKNSLMRKVSVNANVLAFSMDDHVMNSTCKAWKNGKNIWAVVHNGDKDVLNITERGELPEFYESMKKGYIKRQKGAEDDVDLFFDMPADIIREVTGFNLNGKSAGTDFEILDADFRLKMSKSLSGIMVWLEIAGVVVGFLLTIVLAVIFVPKILNVIMKFIAGIFA